MLAGCCCCGGGCGYEGDDLLVCMHFESSLTDRFVHGGDELVAALVLDGGRVTDGVFEESFEGLKVRVTYGLGYGGLGGHFCLGVFELFHEVDGSLHSGEHHVLFLRCIIS